MNNGQTICLDDNYLLHCIDSVWKEEESCSTMDCIETEEQAFCAYGSDPCEPDGLQRRSEDSLQTCRDGYRTVSETLCRGVPNMGMNTYCLEKDDGTFICVYDDGTLK